MAKDSQKKPLATDTRTPFQKFDALAKKIVRVPKRETEDKRGAR
jgi:hypothetical protein